MLTGCSQPAPDTRGADQKTPRDLDAQWARTAASKDLDGTLAYYPDDAIVMPGAAPAATTKQAIRAVWASMLTPEASVTW